MTLSDLHKWRKYTPYVSVSSCLIPWFLIKFESLSKAEPDIKIFVPLLSLIAAYFYGSLDLRRPYWKAEIDRYVGDQIRTGLLAMVPKDLNVTEAERDELARSEIFRELTGVFWEAVEKSEVL